MFSITFVRRWSLNQNFGINGSRVNCMKNSELFSEYLIVMRHLNNNSRNNKIESTR